MNYQYPLEDNWNTQEIIDVIHFFNLIEKAYEASVDRSELLIAYDRFKRIIPSKSEEKVYFSDFEKSSTYSSYHVIKKARDSNERMIRMK